MTNGEIAYLALIILGMTSFAVSLALADLTTTRRSAAAERVGPEK